MEEERRDELHEEVVPQKETAEKEINLLLEKGTKETLEQRYARLSLEYAEQGDLEKSQLYFERRVKLNPRSVDLWRNAARKALSEGNPEMAEEHY